MLMQKAMPAGTATKAVTRALQRCRMQDDRLHAFITLSDTALDEAARLDNTGPQGHPLFGLPLGVKDLLDTAGLRTTYGSAIYRDHVPQQDDLLIARAKAAGAIIIGKTNTPEFGFGALCENALCPSTANPYDLALSSGGSSGGSAAAVAAGLLPAAIGTDFGGSVRTPAAFCGVVGFRPTPGMLPSASRNLAWDSLPTPGLLTRNAQDAITLFEALAGPDDRDPTSWRAKTLPQRAVTRFAVSSDLGGAAAMAKDMRARFEQAVAGLRATGGEYVSAQPDCNGALDIFATVRAAHIHHGLSPLVRQHGDLIAPTVRWNIARGENLSAAAYLQAEAKRSALYRRFVDFFTRHDVLITPSAAIMPFGVHSGEVMEIDGRPLDSLIDYLAITAIITLTGCPAVSIPYWGAGESLPIGLQLIAAPGEDRSLLAFAAELASRSEAFRFRAPPLFAENFQ